MYLRWVGLQKPEQARASQSLGWPRAGIRQPTQSLGRSTQGSSTGLLRHNSAPVTAGTAAVTPRSALPPETHPVQHLVRGLLAQALLHQLHDALLPLGRCTAELPQAGQLVEPPACPARRRLSPGQRRRCRAAVQAS